MISRGPSIWRITDVEVPISFGINAQGPAVTFHWPKPVYLTGMFVFSKSGDDSDSALLSFTISDQNGWDLITNGYQPQQQPVLATVGKGRRWFPLNIQVGNTDIWVIQFQNHSGDERTLTPILYFEFEDNPQ